MPYFFTLIFFLSILCLPVGLISPSRFQRVIRKILGKDATRKNIAGSFSILALVSFVGIGLTAPTPLVTDEVPDQTVELSEEAPAVETTEPILNETIEESKKVEVKPGVASSEESVKESNMVVESQNPSAASSNETVYESETPDYVPPVYEEPAPTPTAWYTCSSNAYNCSDFSTHSEAQSVYDGCWAQTGRDVHGLDGNENDGLACENLP